MVPVDIYVAVPLTGWTPDDDHLIGAIVEIWFPGAQLGAGGWCGNERHLEFRLHSPAEDFDAEDACMALCEVLGAAYPDSIASYDQDFEEDE